MSFGLSSLWPRSRWDETASLRVDEEDRAALEQGGTLLLPMFRERLLRYLPVGGRVARLALPAAASSKIRRVCKPSYLALVDPWAEQNSDVYFGDDNNVVQGEQEARYRSSSKVLRPGSRDNECDVIRKYSKDAAADFVDKSLDWVYIDGNHSQEACLEDLRCWAPKVADDGLLCGHDFAVHAAARSSRFGVIQAVHEFVEETGYKLVAVTVEHFPTFVVAKNRRGDRPKTASTGVRPRAARHPSRGLGTSGRIACAADDRDTPQRILFADVPARDLVIGISRSDVRTCRRVRRCNCEPL